MCICLEYCSVYVIYNMFYPFQTAYAVVRHGMSVLDQLAMSVLAAVSGVVSLPLMLSNRLLG